eukprot:SAG11_NODE_11516_length_755_cov_3.356707_1_plen_180_part_10
MATAADYASTLEAIENRYGLLEQTVARNAQVVEDKFTQMMGMLSQVVAAQNHAGAASQDAARAKAGVGHERPEPTPTQPRAKLPRQGAAHRPADEVSLGGRPQVSGGAGTAGVSPATPASGATRNEIDRGGDDASLGAEPAPESTDLVTEPGEHEKRSRELASDRHGKRANVASRGGDAT